MTNDGSRRKENESHLRISIHRDRRRVPGRVVCFSHSHLAFREKIQSTDSGESNRTNRCSVRGWRIDRCHCRVVCHSDIDLRRYLRWVVWLFRIRDVRSSRCDRLRTTRREERGSGERLVDVRTPKLFEFSSSPTSSSSSAIVVNWENVFRKIDDFCQQ